MASASGCRTEYQTTAAKAAKGANVIIYAPKGATAEEIAMIKEYVRRCNCALGSGQLSATGRVRTEGLLRDMASQQARQERVRAAQAGTPYNGVVGHAPDSTWTGSPASPQGWMDMSRTVNSSLGRQATNYPTG